MENFQGPRRADLQVIRITQHLLESESDYHQPPGSCQAFHKPKRARAKNSFFANKLSSRQGLSIINDVSMASIVEIIRGSDERFVKLEPRIYTDYKNQICVI